MPPPTPLPTSDEGPCNSEVSAQSPASDVTMATANPEGDSPLLVLLEDGEVQAVPTRLEEESAQATPMEIEVEDNLDRTPGKGGTPTSPISKKRQARKRDKK